MKIIYSIAILVSFFFPANIIAQKENIYKNIPQLDDVSGGWMNADTTLMLPSLRNFKAQALCNQDLSSLSWFAAAPYSGGYHTGVLRVNGETPVAQTWRWFPYQALRKTDRKDYNILSTVRMLPENDLVMWKLEFENTSDKMQTLNVQQDLIGFISRYDKEPWGFNYPYPDRSGKTNLRTVEILLTRHNIGKVQKSNQANDYTGQVMSYDPKDKSPRKYPTDDEILTFTKYKIDAKSTNSLIIADSETNCFTGFYIVDTPDRFLTKNSGGSAIWDLQLKPGTKKVIRFLMTYGSSKQIVSENLNRWSKGFTTAFAQTKSIWENRWQKIFRPNNKFISGTFPILKTNDAAIKKVYYTGPLTMLYIMNTGLPAHKRVYLAGGPIWGPTTTFYWDNNEWASLQAVVDPAMMKENLKSWLSIDNSKRYAQDNFTGEGVGNGYVANYYSLFTIFRAYLTTTKDYAFLNEAVNGKKIIDHLYEFSMRWRKISSYGKPGFENEIYKLADFGDDPWNLLECVPTYKHIVPGMNAGYVWMMRETAKFYDRLGNKTRAEQLRNDADKMAKLVLKLYNGDGTWFTLHPYNKKHGIRHVLDFMLVSKFMKQDLSPEIINRMASLQKKN